MIMWVAPIGAFGAIAAVVGETGWSALVSLGQLMLAFYITCAIFIVVVLGAVLRFAAGMNIFSLIRYLAREYLLIVSTSSSEVALPRLVAKMEHLGVSRPVVGITVPTGYSFNLDGTAIYLTMASLFIAQALGTPLAIGEQVSLLLFMMIASKGAAGVTGAGLAVLTGGGLQSHRPDLVEGVPLVVGIDRFMSEARAVTNFSGNAVATVLIGNWVGEFDPEQAKRVFSGRTDRRGDNDRRRGAAGTGRTPAAGRHRSRITAGGRSTAKPHASLPAADGAGSSHPSAERLGGAVLVGGLLNAEHSADRHASHMNGKRRYPLLQKEDPHMVGDLDPTETREWRDAFDSVLEFEGSTGPGSCWSCSTRHAATGHRCRTRRTRRISTRSHPRRRRRIRVTGRSSARIRSLIRWNAVAIVLRANKESSELGGHIASFQSAATLYDTGFQHFWHAPSEGHGGDLVFVQGHCSPGIYARVVPGGAAERGAAVRFRQEVGGGGLSSYPHP